MKSLRHLTLLTVFASLIIFSHCNGSGGGDDTGPDPFEQQADKFVNDWVLTTDGALLESAPWDYNGLTLSVTGDRNGGTATTNIATLSQTKEVSSTVWPETTTWQFSSDTGNTDNPAAGYVLREADGVVCAITVVNNVSLEIRFTISSGSTSRTNGIDGNWTFIFEPAS